MQAMRQLLVQFWHNPGCATMQALAPARHMRHGRTALDSLTMQHDASHRTFIQCGKRAKCSCSLRF